MIEVAPLAVPNPCTKDCPRRTAECKLTCPDHKRYEEARFKREAEKRDAWLHNEAEYNAIARANKRIARARHLPK